MGTLDVKDTLFRRSGRLFANPSCVVGLSMIFDLGATFTQYNQNKTENEADFKAIQSDWYSVGDDLNYALMLFKQNENLD